MTVLYAFRNFTRVYEHLLTHLDPLAQRTLVGSLKLLLDLDHVDLAASDDGAYQ